MRILIFLFCSCGLIALNGRSFAQEPQSPPSHIKVRGRGTSEEILVPVYDVLTGDESARSDLLLRDQSYTQHTPKPFFYKTDVEKMGADAFLIAGVNCDSTLERDNLTITGIPIKQLEGFARPQHAPNMKLSNEGFILESTSLRELLVQDNRSVRNLGLTHQQVAGPLLQAIDAWDQGWIKGDPVDHGVEFKIDGQTYTVKGHGMMDREVGLLNSRPNTKKESDFQPLRKSEVQGRKLSPYCRSGWMGKGLQGTPFNDDLYADLVIQITNPKGQKLVIDGITPHMVYRYGFYQGNPIYRTEPQKIVDFFELKSGGKNSPWAKCSQKTQ